jgi:hypothetical protein
VYVIFRATDNVGIREVVAQVENANATPTPVAGQPDVCVNRATSAFLPDTYALIVPNSTSNYVVSVTATDTSGLTAKATVQIVTP